MTTPPAWVWVPRGATDKMLEAAWGEALAESAVGVWNSMIAAAPPREWTEEECEAACRAHDAEDAAQVGEPSPWDIDGDTPLEDYAEFRSRRIAAFRVALTALGGVGT